MAAMAKEMYYTMMGLMFRRIVCAAGCGLLMTGALLAAEPSISATVDRTTVPIDGRLTLEVSISGGSADLPDMPAFSVTSSGRAENISIINGAMTRSTSLRYTLAPRGTGTYTIPAITMNADGKTYSTQPITIEVVPGGSGGTPAPTPATAQGSAAGGPADGRTLFVTAALDKHTAYVNEKIVYTFKFFRRVNLMSAPNFVPADFSGFWREDLPAKNYQTTVNGIRYAVDEVPVLLFPARAGTFTLGAATLRAQVQDADPGDPFAAFGMFFSGGRTVELRTEPITVKVLPLPGTGKPKDFSGAVGTFSVAAATDKRAARVNEAITLTVTVTGVGSLKTIPDPALPDWPDLRKYETAGTAALDTSDGTPRGTKTFKTVVVPLTPGKKTIQPISFSYFDPVLKQYRTVATDPLTLDIAPGDPNAQPLMIPGVPADTATDTGPAGEAVTTDIHYIKQVSDWRPWRGPLYRRGWFIGLCLLPFVALMGVAGYLMRRQRLSSDVAFARKLRAGKTARRYLKSARAALGGGTPAEITSFYTALTRALTEFIAHKLNVAPAGLTGAVIECELTRRAVPAELIAETKTILDECDLVRFASTAVSADMMRGMYGRAEAAIGALEKML